MSTPLKIVNTNFHELFLKKTLDREDKNVFEGDMDIYIPFYQRPYVWDEKEIERLLEDYESNCSEEGTSFYLGNLIFHEDSKKKKLNIIDGQQRLTTLALIAHLIDKDKYQEGIDWGFDSPKSQNQIKENYNWLKENGGRKLIEQKFDLSRIGITLIITPREDDAYHFFETHNTSGVRLSGLDIIKAHHLRPIDESVKMQELARGWEEMAKKTDWEEKDVNLNYLLKGLMKVRFHNALNPRTPPSFREGGEALVKEASMDEFMSLEAGKDLSYGSYRIQKNDGENTLSLSEGYDMRQPLWEGENTLNFFSYWYGQLKNLKIEENSLHADFQNFYKKIKGLSGCYYLDKFYDACLLFYMGRFGTEELEQASVKLFGVIYYLRLELNSVRENSVFVRDERASAKLFDYIQRSYHPQELFKILAKISFKDLKEEDLSKSPIRSRFLKELRDKGILSKEPSQNLKQEFESLIKKGSVSL